MNKHVNPISGRLSLRPPQRVSLEILLEIIKRTLESGEDMMVGVGQGSTKKVPKFRKGFKKENGR
jgi:hypothetical protein